MNRALFRQFASAVFIVLILLALFIIYRNGRDWIKQISEVSWTPDLLLIAVSGILLFLSLWLTPFGWLMICRGLGCTIDGRELRAVWFASQLGRYVPGKIWLFAGRAGYLKAKGFPALKSVLVPVYELLHAAASVGVIALSAALFFPDFLSSNTLRAAVLISGICMIVLPLLHPVQKFIYRLKNRTSGNTEPNEREGIPFLAPVESIRVLLLFSLLWSVRGISLFLWLSALGVPCRGIWACMAAAPLSWFAGYIVFLVPGGIGVREAAAVIMIAGPGETGPVLAAVIGQRLLLSSIELILAAVHAGSTPFFRREGNDQ